MNFTTPPSLEDMEIIGAQALEALPEELLEFCESLTVTVEEFPDETIERDLDLEDSYDLLALYKNGKEISPGVEKKTADGEDILVLYRRPILDVWCESLDDLAVLVRQIMIEELGRHFNFSDSEIDEMVGRHFQGML